MPESSSGEAGEEGSGMIAFAAILFFSGMAIGMMVADIMHRTIGKKRKD